MIPLIFRRLRDKFSPEPLPPANSFKGQTVLVTGATAGLGLAAALHFATLGATITSRTLSQGNAAKDKVERCAGIVGQGRIHVHQLDLSQYSSCLAFVEHLKQAKETSDSLNVAILNAGLIDAKYRESPEGWLVGGPCLFLDRLLIRSSREQTIQVNTLSTTLLAVLLLQ